MPDLFLGSGNCRFASRAFCVIFASRRAYLLYSMNKYFVILFSVLLFASCAKEDIRKYEIKGEVVGMDMDGRAVYLSRIDGDSFTNTDSTLILGNSFVFKGIQDVPQIMFLRFTNIAGERYVPSPFILENGDIAAVIKDSIISVSGTLLNEQFNAYNASEKRFSAERSSLSKRYKDSLSVMTRDMENSFISQYADVDNRERDHIISIIDKNPDNVLGAYVFVNNEYKLPNRYKRNLLKHSDALFRSYEGVAAQEDEMKQYDKIAEGNFFTDVDLLGLDGSEHKLSEYAGKGSFLIVNFWASWSAPSIASISELKGLQREFRDKGVSMLSISLDTIPADWLGAVKQHYLWWPQLSDMKGWNGGAVKSYLVNSIPSLMLFNPDGTIITTEGDISEIRNKLLQLLQ